MDLYTALKTLHIISATILFGTGLGIAFFMFRSWFSETLQEKYYAANNTVLADYLFTFPAAIIQPVSGLALLHITAYDADSFWLSLSYGLYMIAGLCWIPVVWIQIQLKKLCAEALANGTELPERYHTLFKGWFMLGWPAFIAFFIIFYLMVAKPT